jgi:hypothetical protein
MVNESKSASNSLISRRGSAISLRSIERSRAKISKADRNDFQVLKSSEDAIYQSNDSFIPKTIIQ